MATIGEITVYAVLNTARFATGAASMVASSIATSAAVTRAAGAASAAWVRTTTSVSRASTQMSASVARAAAGVSRVVAPAMASMSRITSTAMQGVQNTAASASAALARMFAPWVAAASQSAARVRTAVQSVMSQSGIAAPTAQSVDSILQGITASASATVSAVSSGISSLASGLGNALAVATEGVSVFVGQTISAVSSIFGVVANITISIVSTIMSAIKGVITTAYGIIKSTISGLYSLVTGTISSVFSSMVSIMSLGTIGIDGQGGAFIRLARAIGLATVAWYAYKKLVEGFSLLAQAEQMQASFEGLMGSPEAGEELFSRVQDLALRTSFTMESAASAAQKLLAADFAGGDIVPTLEMLGNLAMGNSEKLGRLSKSYSEIRGRGHATGEEFREFIHAGVALGPALAESLGKSTEEILAMRSAGQISFPMVQKALQDLTTGSGRFAGQLGRQAETIGGKWQILMETLQLKSRQWAEMFAKAFDVKGKLQWLIDKLSGVNQYMGRFQAVLNAIATGFDFLYAQGVKAAQGIMDYFGFTVGDIHAGFKWLLDVLITGFNNLPLLFRIIATSSQLAWATISAEAKFQFTENIPPALTYLSNVFKAIMGDLGTYSQRVFENIGANAKIAAGNAAVEMLGMAEGGLIKGATSAEGLKAIVPMLNLLPDAAAEALSGSMPVEELRKFLLDDVNTSTAGRKSAYIAMPAMGESSVKDVAIPEIKRRQGTTPEEFQAAFKLDVLTGKLVKEFEKVQATAFSPAERKPFELPTGDGPPANEDDGKKNLAGAMANASADAYSAIVKAMGGDKATRIEEAQLDTLLTISEQLARDQPQTGFGVADTLMA